MSLLMGITLSFFLSLVGLCHARRFSLPAWAVNFALSAVISLVIGFIVPMRPLLAGAVGRLGLRPGSIPARLVEALVSDVLYTPLITLAMVALAWFTVRARTPHAPLSFPRMFLGSLAVCMAAGFVLILVFMPLFMRLLTGKRREG